MAQACPGEILVSPRKFDVPTEGVCSNEDKAVSTRGLISLVLSPWEEVYQRWRVLTRETYLRAISRDETTAEHLANLWWLTRLIAGQTVRITPDSQAATIFDRGKVSEHFGRFDVRVCEGPVRCGLGRSLRLS